MTSRDETFARLLAVIETALAAEGTLRANLQKICDLLRAEVRHYDWVGFYLVDGERPGELVLGPFSGAPTEHRRIPFGRGICGRAAETRRTFVVPDVSREGNYLACSPAVRAEVVVPVLVGGEVWGELDIDSHRVTPFTPADAGFLEKVCSLVAAAVERS